MSTLTFVSSQKKKDRLLYDGYLYQEHSDRNGLKFWNCKEKRRNQRNRNQQRCKSSCSTRHGVFFREPTAHNHPKIKCKNVHKSTHASTTSSVIETQAEANPDDTDDSPDDTDDADDTTILHPNVHMRDRKITVLAL